MNQPLTIQDLARLWKQYKKSYMEKYPNGPSLDSALSGGDIELFGFDEFIDWLIENDTNQNPHRYTVDGLDTESAPEL